MTTLDNLTVDLFNGPTGRNGFRTGMWTAKAAGQEFQFFASVSHHAELRDQLAHLKQLAAKHLGD